MLSKKMVFFHCKWLFLAMVCPVEYDAQNPFYGEVKYRLIQCAFFDCLYDFFVINSIGRRHFQLQSGF